MRPSERTVGDVREVDITAEMQVAYLDYAMSVIVARALPDVRDGLKPVQRRILYAMHDMGLISNRPYKKSARIVGEVLGKYHPHNDSSVYDAMVRMAQEFSLRYPLVDGQGNFGSIDGDNAAAMRYTEARLAAISDLMLSDIGKDTIDWRDNFDTTLKEPAILPAALPNLLVNGANGIAVGMATNTPPHNIAEVVDATIHLIDNFAKIDEIAIDDLLQFIKGPDFPTGGILFRYRQGGKGEEEIDAISQGYATGRARLILQAKAHFEEMSRSRSRIVVTDLPYQTNKTNLLERIALLVRDGKIEGITDLRDESDRTGMRIVVELTRNVEAKAVLARLLRLTPMQQTFGMSLLALVDGEPVTLTLKRILRLFIEHRQEIIRRRSEFDLAKARVRSHIVEGLLKALDILDEVIQTIRRSQRVETARANLMRAFGFTQVQAQAILDMPLRWLTALERKQLQNEQKELQKRIAYLEELLADGGKILGVIREELLSLRQQHADPRRTQIVERAQGTLTATDLLPDRRAWVALSANGELRRQDFGGISRASLRQVGQNAAVALLTANTRDQLFIFAAHGRCQRLGVHEISQDAPKHLADLTDYSRRDTIAAMLALPQAAHDGAGGFLFLVTRQGTVKRVALSDFMQAAALGNLDVMRVAAKDRLGWAFVTAGSGEVVLVTRKGRSIRFPEEMVRVMGPAARGVVGMNLERGDDVIAALPVIADGELLTATAAGFVKRTPMSEFRVQGRSGSGIIAHKISQRSGDLVGAAMLTPEHEFATFVTQRGVAKPLELDGIPASGRNTQGAQVVELARDDAVAAVQVVSRIVSAMDSPPPAPAPRVNGRGNGAGAQRASEGRAQTAKAGPAAVDDGQERTEELPKRGKRKDKTAPGAADREATAPAKEKTRPPPSEAAGKGKPTPAKGSPPGRSAAKETPAGKASTTETVAGASANRSAKPPVRRAKSPKRSPQDGGREAAPKVAANSAPGQRPDTANTGKAVSGRPASQPSTAPRRAAESPKPGNARAGGRTQRAAKPADQLVQGQLLEESTAARAAAKPEDKVGRVSSVTRSQKKKKR